MLVNRYKYRICFKILAEDGIKNKNNEKLEGETDLRAKRLMFGRKSLCGLGQIAFLL